MILGERLKKLRTAKGISQKELAEIVDVSKSAISKYESGILEPNIRVQLLLARTFNVSVDYLIGNTDFNILEDNKELQKLKDVFTQLNENNRILALARMIELLKEQ